MTNKLKIYKYIKIYMSVLFGYQNYIYYVDRKSEEKNSKLQIRVWDSLAQSYMQTKNDILS